MGFAGWSGQFVCFSELNVKDGPFHAPLCPLLTHHLPLLMEHLSDATFTLAGELRDRVGGV